MFGASPKPLKPTPGERPGARCRTVVGDCFVGYGMIAKNPGDNWKSWNMLVERRRQDESQRAKDEIVRQERILRERDEFQKITDKKRIRNMIQHRVEVGLEMAYRDMEVRKQKLKQLFREEDAIFAQEFVERDETEKQRKAEEAKRRAEELRNQAAMEEKKLVEEKRLQQYIEKSEQLREYLIKRNRMEIKWAQELQMKDHERIRAQEQEMERMWEEVARRDYEHKVALEMEKAEKEFQKQREFAEAALKQKQEIENEHEEKKRRLKDEETATVIKMMEDLKKVEEQERVERKEKMEQRRKELDEQVKAREQELRRLKEKEKLAASVFLQYAEETWLKEHASRAPTKEDLRREAEMFMAYKEQLERDRIEKEKELERIIQEEWEKLDKQKMERKAVVEAAHRRLEEQVYRERAEQLQWKHNKEEEERRKAAEECKLQKAIHEQNMQLEKDHEFQVQMLRKQYFKDLQDQVEYQKTLRERERREIEREWQTGRLDEEHYLRLLKELMEKKFTLKVHPFRHVIDSSAHLTAEEGRCRCPPEIELDPEAKTER